MTDTTYYITLRRRVVIKKWIHYDKLKFVILIPNGNGKLSQYAQTGNVKAALTCAHKLDEKYCDSAAKAPA